MSIASLIWYAVSVIYSMEGNDREAEKESPYDWTVKDVALTDCVLNLISWPFAIQFLDNKAALAEKCSVSSLPSANTKDFYGPLGLIAFLGALSALLLAGQIIRYVVSSSEKPNNLDFWFEVVCNLNIMFSFIGNWVVWSCA